MSFKRQFILSCVLVACIGTLQAQKEIPLTTVRTASPVSVRMPVKMDSVNMKGKKFETKELIETKLSIPHISTFKNEVLATDSTNFLYLPQSQHENQLQLLTFQVSADRYSKGKLKITAPSVFELYIDGKKETSKLTIEDSLKVAKSATKDLTIIPNAPQRVIVKYLSAVDNKAIEAIKIGFTPNKADSLATFSFVDAGKRFTNLQDIMDGVRITGTSMSPNGQFMFINYSSVAKGGTVTRYTELVDTKTNRTTNLATLAVKWMPRSNMYYYTVPRGNKTQLITVDPASLKETILIEDLPTGSFNFSPNEQYLLYNEKEDNDTRKGDLKLLGSPRDRMDGYYTNYFIYKYDLATGVKQALTFGKTTTSLRAVSSDSKYILFACSQEVITERPFSKSSMYKMNVETLEMDTIWASESFANTATFSPDNKQLLITGSPEAFGGIGSNVKEGQIPNSYDTQAYLMDLATKKITPISKNFNPSINRATWNKSDNLIYFSVIDKDYERVYTYNTKTDKYSLIPMLEEVVNSFSIAELTGKASYAGQSVGNRPKAYTLDLKTNKSTLVSDPSKDVFDQLQLAAVSSWTFEASDGTTIDGRYYLPPNFDASKKYPMIVYYYGGTTPTSRAFEFPYSMQIYASLGYVVYVVQPSGATGYGQEFSARHVNAWGKRTAEDIIEGTKQFLIAHPYVDAKRIGCIGASYGGFMTMYLQTQTDMFAAAISHAGISSLSSYWGEGYWGYGYSSAASAHSYPWNNKELYIEQSPLFNADKIKTPLLLLHGMVDTNVPVGESIQMYLALKILGSPVEFVQVKDENHGIAKYDRRIAWNNSIYGWFAKWLKNEPEWWDNQYPKLDK